MRSTLEQTGEEDEARDNLLALALLAPIVGAMSGFLGAMFRLALARADHLRNTLIFWAHGQEVTGIFIVVTACAGTSAIAAWLVRRFSPTASGSGIPCVEAVLKGELQEAPFRVILVKFFGGLLAIGSGLALGREGPSIQMGASFAHFVGKICHRNWPDCRVLIAAGAGAGLATAFNAPIAGAIFVLEELVRRFEPRIAIVALGASSSAIVVVRIILGDMPDFHVQNLAYPSDVMKPLFFILGLLAGVTAIAYNKAIIGAMAAVEKLHRWPVELRAAMIGGAVGILAWIAPEIVGGGDFITQRTLLGMETLAMIPLLFLVRFILGAVSYAAETPGGLFAPMLVLGAQLGLVFGLLCRTLSSDFSIKPEAFAVVGMAAFFCGVVRAPLTGIVLVTEMTGNVSMLLPMLGACFAAMLVPMLLGAAPIYDSLSVRRIQVSQGSHAAIGDPPTDQSGCR
jgi:chloride channel protein, CIC family